MSPLRWLQSTKMDNTRITQQVLALQPFYSTVQHRPSKQNTVADFLSCWHEIESTPNLQEPPAPLMPSPQVSTYSTPMYDLTTKRGEVWQALARLSVAAPVTRP